MEKKFHMNKNSRPKWKKMFLLLLKDSSIDKIKLATKNKKTIRKMFYLNSKSSFDFIFIKKHYEFSPLLIREYLNISFDDFYYKIDSWTINSRKDVKEVLAVLVFLYKRSNNNTIKEYISRHYKKILEIKNKKH
jgi:hypothetical protein